MGIENLQVPGICGGFSARYDANPSDQSILLEDSTHAIIARPLGFPPDISEKLEVQTRLGALELHREFLPDFTQKTEPILIQGLEKTDSGTIPRPVIARFIPRLNDVRPISDLGGKEILSDSALCGDLARINLGYLKILLTRGVVCDQGYYGEFGSKLPVIRRVTHYLTSANTMIGTNKAGERETFCDPDWYSVPGFKKKLQNMVLFSARAVFFKTAEVVQKTKERFKSVSRRSSEWVQVGSE
jgi:hypothetical protein